MIFSRITSRLNLVKSKEQQLLEELRKARNGGDDVTDENPVNDGPRTFLPSDVLPAENVAHLNTEPLEPLKEMKTGGLYKPKEGEVEYDTDEVSNREFKSFLKVV